MSLKEPYDCSQDSQSQHKTVARDDNTKSQTTTRQPSKLENESAFLEENGIPRAKIKTREREDTDEVKDSTTKRQDNAETKTRTQTRTKIGQDTM